MARQTVAICLLLFVIFPVRAFADKQPPIELWLSDRVGQWGQYVFPILGGREQHETPKGSYQVQAKHQDFYSNKYKAPMPYSVFFTEQCAIHVGSLRVPSHGCVHVDWQTGMWLFQYAEIGKTRVIVHK